MKPYTCVFDELSVSKEELIEAMRNDKELHKIIQTVRPEEEGRPQGYGCETLYLCF